MRRRLAARRKFIKVLTWRVVMPSPFQCVRQQLCWRRHNRTFTPAGFERMDFGIDTATSFTPGLPLFVNPTPAASSTLWIAARSTPSRARVPFSKSTMTSRATPMRSASIVCVIQAIPRAARHRSGVSCAGLQAQSVRGSRRKITSASFTASLLAFNWSAGMVPPGPLRRTPVDRHSLVRHRPARGRGERRLCSGRSSSKVRPTPLSSPDRSHAHL